VAHVLERILETKRGEILASQSRVSAAEMERLARAAPPPRDFEGALRARIAAGRPAVIAEAKRASPSKGLLRANFDPAAIARSYERAGAACLSVLTDREYFRGAPEHLIAAREACALPVLRKDFTIDPYQVFEARALGADCILLIASALALPDMLALEEVALGLGMAVLAEVHDGAELEQVLRLRTPLVGINNRNLRSFETRLQTTTDLLPRIQGPRIAVSESGIASPSDVRMLWKDGVRVFLVGEALMRATDPGAGLRILFENC
jgi:indole-3-glycerol phosphate synthase